MEIRILLLTAFIASSGLPSVQPKTQTGIKTIADDVNADSKVQQNFRSLFDSLSKYDVRKTDSLRGSLEREAVKEKEAFDSMKEDFRLARENNAYRQRNLYKHGGNGEKAAVFKRETDENTGTPGSESKPEGEKETGAEDKTDSLSGAKVDEKKDDEKKSADRYKNSNERNDRREDDRQYKPYRSDRDNSPRYDRGGYSRGGSYDRRDDRFSYDRRAGAWSSPDRADDRYGGRREGGGSSYDRDDRPSYGRRDGPRSSYDRNDRRDNWPPYGRRDDRRPFRDDDDGRRSYRRDDDYVRRPNRGDNDDGDGRRAYRRDNVEERRSYHKDDSRNDTQSKKTDDDRRANGTSESSKDGGDDGKGGVVDTRHNRTDTGSTNGTSETASEPAKCENDANDTHSEPGGGRDDKSARRRDDEPDRRGGRYERREDDRNDRRGDNRYDRDGDRYDRRGDNRYDRDGDRYDRRGDRYDRRDRDDRRGDRYDRREDDRHGGRGDRDERRDDRYYKRDDPSDDRDSKPSYRREDRGSSGNRFEGDDEKPTFRRRFEKYDRPESDRGDNDSKQKSEERQSRFGRRDDDRRDFRRDDFRTRDDSRRDRQDRQGTKRPWVARGSVIAHDLFVEALKESCNVLSGQLNYIKLLSEPIKAMYGPNATQTNVTWTLAQPMKLLNRTEKCIQDKNHALIKLSMKDLTFDEMVTPMDQEYLDQLSGHWMALKNFLLDHVPAPEYKEQYASVVDQVGKANDNMSLEYKIVKNIVKKLDKMKN